MNFFWFDSLNKIDLFSKILASSSHKVPNRRFCLFWKLTFVLVILLSDQGYTVVQEEDARVLQAMLWIGQVHWDKRTSWHHRVRRRIATFGVSIWKPEEEIQNVPAGFEDEKGLWPKVLLTKVLWKRSSDPQSESLGRCVNFGIKPTKISFLICLHFICS